MWRATLPRIARCEPLLASMARLGAVRRRYSFPEHPHKGTVTTLLHQRPFQRVELPSLVSSFTIMQPQIHNVPGGSVGVHGSAKHEEDDGHHGDGNLADPAAHPLEKLALTP